VDKIFEKLISRPLSLATQKASSPEAIALAKRTRSWSEYAFIQSEATNLADYIRDKAVPGGTYQLNQSVANGHGVQCTGKIMYSIIKNPSIHFNVGVGRPWTSMELALMQGFPVLPRLACPLSSKPRACCSYAVQAVSGIPPCTVRDYNKTNAQVGNSQQVFVVGSVLMYIFIFTQPNRIASDPFVAFCRSAMHG
jgi:hypothetical protein